MLQEKEITIKTPRNGLKITCHVGFTTVDKLNIKKDQFYAMCRLGCRNFGNKYSCPPFSPDLHSIISGADTIFVLVLKIDLKQLSGHGYLDYHILKIGNAVIKPRIEKMMRSLESEFGGRFLSTGACRLCKPCQKRLCKPCKHPDKMRFSLESMGVDCNKLVMDVFGFPLLWYKEKKAPDYTCVVCALPISSDKREIILGSCSGIIDSLE